MKYQQEPPFCIQVELSEGCNLYCNFCGLQGIREKTVKNFKFMTGNTAIELARQISDLGWTSRIEFAMHGEPTMHPDYIGIIRTFRFYLPKNQLMMTSNGGGLLRKPGVLKNLNDLFDAGLNVFAFDAYDSVKIKEKVLPAIESSENERNFTVHYYPEDLSASPHTRRPVKKTKMFVRIKDIDAADQGNHATLNNHCGAGAAPNKKGHGHRCAKVFREISVRYNGNIAICCNDWRGVYKIGNTNKEHLGVLWQNDRFNAARKFLVKGHRHMLSPCDICDAKSYRVGLLPDKKGQITLPNPTKKDEKIVAEAIRGRNYATKVKRPWE